MDWHRALLHHWHVLHLVDLELSWLRVKPWLRVLWLRLELLEASVVVALWVLMDIVLARHVGVMKILIEPALL